MTRKVCLRRGHHFSDSSGMLLPYVFCARWFCRAMAVAPWANPDIAVDLHNAIPDEYRFPPQKIERT